MMADVGFVYCGNCAERIAVLDEDGESRPTEGAMKLYVIGGFPLYACLNCGMVQILTRAGIRSRAMKSLAEDQR